MLTFPLQCFLNDKNIFHINFTCSPTFQWKLLVMAKHGELFESKILGSVQPCYSTVPITCTQTWIHLTQSLHYNKSLKRSSLRHRCNKLRCNHISWQKYQTELYLARKNATLDNFNQKWLFNPLALKFWRSIRCEMYFLFVMLSSFRI